MSQISNATLVEKAVIATDALATAGKLNPQQSDKFIDYVFDQTMLRQNARTIKFTPETLNIDKIGVGKRVAVAATEAEDPSVRGAPRTGAATALRARQKECRRGEDDKDGGSDSQYVKDAYLGLVDGWLKLAEDAHRVDALSANVAPGLFSKMLNNMPPKFKRDRKKLRFLASIETEQLYRERLSQRATPGSDRSIENADAMTPFGVPLVGVPLLSQTPKVVEHVAVNSDGTTATALKYSNIDNVVVSASTLSSTAATPYIANTDYTVDLVNGSITRLTGQAIGSAATVKVTYTTTRRPHREAAQHLPPRQHVRDHGQGGGAGRGDRRPRRRLQHRPDDLRSASGAEASQPGASAPPRNEESCDARQDEGR